VLSLPSSSSVAKPPTTVLSAMSAAGPSDSTASRKSPSRKSPPSHKTPPSGEYLIVPREPPANGSSAQSASFIGSNQTSAPGHSPASQESAIVKWRAAASQKSGALHLSAVGYQVRLGELPKPPPAHLVLLSAPEGARAEQYRLLRLRLQEQGDPRVMVITSSRPGEGKTLCSANLALAYAEGGGPKVVLVDTHLSSARLSSMLGVPAADQAAAAHDLRSGSPEVWQYLPNLYLVPASALGNKAQRTAVLSSPEFAGLIADLREAFDYVIIDVPAISEAADAKLVLRHADAGILLVRAQLTTSGVVSTALDRLGRNTVSGAVLNVFS
jgi:Mrp family chromosome partitioning ATPase